LFVLTKNIFLKTS